MACARTLSGANKFLQTARVKPAAFSSRLSRPARSMAGTQQAAPSYPQLTQESMWPSITSTYDQAQSSGAAIKTETTYKLLPDQSTGITFVVREASALNKKPPAPPRQEPQPAQSEGKQPSEQQASTTQQLPPRKWFNPFLPPEPALLVGQLSKTHLLVLNKFNVVAHHTLVVTRNFQAQHEPLNAADLEAAWQVIKGMSTGRSGSGLAFYNNGEFSGRSQPHKHLQIVPLPLVDSSSVQGQDDCGPPVEALVNQAAAAAGAKVLEPIPVRQLPYVCYAALLTNSSGREPSPKDLEQVSCALLQRACPTAQLPTTPPPAPTFTDDDLKMPDEPPQPPPGAPSYNTIMTPRFMLTVPRRAESAEGIAINALGFAGTILVKSKEYAEQVEESGPSSLLAQVGVPWDS